ncbi:MAG TPA: hypothetical protein VFP87_08205, partial [Chitinophagaceae bacterium]|nr:hypothetical protein [Chitinophagaceae bacterium]
HTKLSEIMAYYESDGQLTGTGKTISVDDLPEELTKAIAREYGGYAIQRAVEYSPSIVVSGISGRENALGIYNGDRVLYFVEVTNGKFEKILKVSSSGYIDVLKSKEKI